MRSLDELISEEPAWPLVQEWIAQATRTVEVLDATEPSRSDTLHALQVTTRSPMGAITYETGGLLLDHGWLRFLGSGHPRLKRSIVDWNRGRTWQDPASPPAILLVADDILGGLFAVNGGALKGAPGHVHYFAPDTLDWESVELGYTEFLGWALSGDLDTFYAGYRWEGWETEVGALSGDQGLSVYPFLFAEGPPIHERSRKAVPMSELFDFQLEARQQLGPAKEDDP